MKLLLLCGGYATRLWPLTKDKPKALLEVAGKPILNYIVEKTKYIHEIDEIIVSTNKKFEEDFIAWSHLVKTRKPIKIIIEPTTREEEKFGAIAGINYVIEKCGLDDYMIIAGDNIFGFYMEDFIKAFKGKPVVAAFNVKNKEKAKLYGIVSMDEDKKITSFEEKPVIPRTTLAATCCYIFQKEIMKLITDYIMAGNSKDAPGKFLEWLIKKNAVYSFVFDEYWFDIGDFSSLEAARIFMISETT